MTLSMLMIPALVTGCGYSEKQIQQELSYQEPDQKELHEEYQYLAAVSYTHLDVYKRQDKF